MENRKAWEKKEKEFVSNLGQITVGRSLEGGLLSMYVDDLHNENGRKGGCKQFG